VQPGVWAAS
jgi:hypothetical protein